MQDVSKNKSLIGELQRRNVFRVAIAYLAVAWLLTEVASTVFPLFGVPDWGVRFIVILFALGFLPALVFSWVYELTAEGLKREKDVVRDKSITQVTAKRLDAITIGVVVMALLVFVAGRFYLGPAETGHSGSSQPGPTQQVETHTGSSAYPPGSVFYV